MLVSLLALHCANVSHRKIIKSNRFSVWTCARLFLELAGVAAVLVLIYDA